MQYQICKIRRNKTGVLARGHWMTCRLKPQKYGDEPIKDVIVSCPDCGEITALHQNEYSLLSDNVVHPIFVCPRPTCTFSEVIQLRNLKNEMETG